MELCVINTGFFKLDGGAMFGVVPKSLWSKTNPADSNNMCTWALRCLLVKDGNKAILIDNGIGNKQDEKFFSHYYLHGKDSLDGSLEKAGVSRKDITDMFLTHLHFDHCGGSIEYNPDHSHLQPSFANARYWSNPEHWKWATEPNAREKASFLKENILPIQESGQLHMIPSPGTLQDIHPGISVSFMRGHTDAMMIPHIKLGDKTVVFMADLLPSAGHIPLPYVMGYDTRPLLTLMEKGEFLKAAARNKWILFLEHDPENEACTVQETEKGIRLENKGRLADFI
ncbi:MAG: MBL fold metallo-hydrolase [Bacteroidia bacterium]|nr:MBL fold metallo-hydrolase [Bacteroidia bacterium]